jgi:hypothetical protein
MCLSPDSACAEHTTANIAASQKVTGTTALNGFMVLLLFSARQRLRISSFIDTDS